MSSIGVAVDVREDKVLLVVRQMESGQVVSGVMEKGEAKKLAEFLGKAAYEAHYGVPPPPNRSAISEQKRMDLIVRVAHMLRDLQERGRKPKYTAMLVVDEVLKVT